MPERLRILHVVGAMNPGGVESWLMALLRRADRSEIAMDFLVHTTSAALYDAEIRGLGGRIIACPDVRRPAYVREFNHALRRHGPYDVVHSHVHWFSGLTIPLARRGGVRLRIAHSHSDSSASEAGAGPLRAVYRAVMARGMHSSATHLLAASGPAARALFGAGWRRSAQVIYCGVDFAPFAERSAAEDRASAREELGIERGDIVFGHVGSFHKPKNHSFLCTVAALATGLDARVRVLCVGEGVLRPQIEAHFEAAGVRAIFPGLRRDIPRLLRAMDVFVFPSLYEGLPLAVIEAQAAGLPCVVSANITREVDVVSGLVRWLALVEGPRSWAEAALRGAKQPVEADRGLTILRESPFSVEASLENVRRIYQTSSFV